MKQDFLCYRRKSCFCLFISSKLLDIYQFCSYTYVFALPLFVLLIQLCFCSSIIRFAHAPIFLLYHYSFCSCTYIFAPPSFILLIHAIFLLHRHSFCSCTYVFAPPSFVLLIQVILIVPFTLIIP